MNMILHIYLFFVWMSELLDLAT